MSRTEQTIEVVRGIEDTSNGISSVSNLGSGVVGSGVVGSAVVGLFEDSEGSAVVVAPRAEVSMLHAASGL
jgi:hypothetical protein